jgi:predicted PurR-regulated permease PerM
MGDQPARSQEQRAGASGASGAPASEGRAGTDWRRVHLWQVQPVRDVLLIGAAYLMLHVGYLLKTVTVPMLLAMGLAYLFEPLVKRMVRVKWVSRHGAAAALIVGGAVVVVVPVLVGIGFATVQGAALAGSIATSTRNVVMVVQSPAAMEQSIEPLQHLQAYQALPKGLWRALAEDLSERRRKVVEYQKAIDEERPPPFSKVEIQRYQLLETAVHWVQENADAIARAVGQRAVRGGAEAVSAALGAVKSLGVLVFTGFLTAFFFFFFSSGWGKVLAFWHGLIPEKRKGRVIDLLQQMDRVIAGFVRGRLIICALQSVFFSIAYWLVGVPAPLIVGPVVGVLCIVPYLGLISIPLSILLLALDSGGSHTWLWIILAPIVVYVVAQALDDYLLSPMIQGKATDMDTPSILFASLAGGVLAGFYGVLLAIPVAACIKILLRELFWPRVKAWAEGRAPDVLPISQGDTGMAPTKR